MTNLLPENNMTLSRQNLLDIWKALKQFDKTPIILENAAKSANIPIGALKQAIKYLGYEVALWNDVLPTYVSKNDKEEDYGEL